MNIDAVGPSGQQDRLYPCPEEAQCVTWSAKAYHCFLNDTSNAYCPSVNQCINTKHHSCETHCAENSRLSGYEQGVRVCLRDSDRDGRNKWIIINTINLDRK